MNNTFSFIVVFVFLAQPLLAAIALVAGIISKNDPSHPLFFVAREAAAGIFGVILLVPLGFALCLIVAIILGAVGALKEASSKK